MLLNICQTDFKTVQGNRILESWRRYALLQKKPHPNAWASHGLDITKSVRLQSHCLLSQIGFPSSRALGKILVSVQFSHSVVCDSLRPLESQHTRQPCMYVCTNSRSLHKLMSVESVMPSNCLILCCPLLLLPLIFPSIRSSQMTQFFTSDGQSIGVSASASVLPMTIQD